MNATTSPRVLAVCDEPGAKLNIGVCRWAPELVAANIHLLTLLAELTGRGESVGYSFIETGSAESWMTLRDVDPPAVEAAASRIRRKYPEWRLDAGSAVGIHAQLDVHFNTAQARWLKEQGVWRR